MSKYIPKEITPSYVYKKIFPKELKPSTLLGKLKPDMPEINIPEIPTPPRVPEAPPAPQAGAGAAKKDNKRRSGYKSNLFTGGKGLGSINKSNLAKRVLSSKLGLSK